MPRSGSQTGLRPTFSVSAWPRSTSSRGSPTTRLARAFADRVSDLSDETRLLLLVAALNDSDDVGEVLRAGSVMTGTPLISDLLEPAASAAIIDLDLQTIRFRHPLIRSAV